MANIATKIDDISDSQWMQVNEFNRKITKEFLEESTALSPNTLTQYASCLRIFFWWVCEYCNNKRLVDIKSIDFLKYQNYLMRRGLSSSAIRLKRAAVSSINGYILTYYEDDYPTFKNFITKKITAPPKNEVHEKKPMNDEEWALVLQTLEEREDWQKLAYLKFTYSTGCRRAESRQLLKDVANSSPIVKTKKIKNDDGTEEEKEIVFYQTSDIRCKGKGIGGKVRKLQFSQDAMDAIKKWLEVRGEDNCPYVFVSRRAGEIKQVSMGTFNDWCSECFSKIIGRRVHPHQMREKRATDMVVLENKDIKAAQALLGHENSSTTEIYVIRDGTEDVEDAFL